MDAERRPPVMADVARVAGRVAPDRLPGAQRPSQRAAEPPGRGCWRLSSELGYRRNLVARALATRHSRTLGVISFDTTLYGPASTLHGIEQAARAAGYFVSIVEPAHHRPRRRARGDRPPAPSRASTGIVVVAPQRSAASALEDLPPGMPAVAVEGGARRRRSPTVCVDQVAGARLATEHLLALGHETVWHVRGPSDWLEAEGRVAGWRAALIDAGRPVPEPLDGRLEPALRLRRGAAARRARRQGRRGVRRQRPDGARRAARAHRGGRAGARGDERRRLRRRARVGVLLAAAHHGPAGLRRGRAGTASTCSCGRSPSGTPRATSASSCRPRSCRGRAPPRPRAARTPAHRTPARPERRWSTGASAERTPPDEEDHQVPPDRRARRDGGVRRWRIRRLRRRGRRSRRQDHDGLLPGRRGERLAHREHQVDPGGGQGGRHRAEVLRRAAEAGEPDQGDPLVHPAEGRRDRLLAGGRVRLGHRAQGGQGRRDPGDPHRPGRGLHGHLAVQDLPRLGLRRGGQEGRRVAGRGVQGRPRTR